MSGAGHGGAGPAEASGGWEALSLSPSLGSNESDRDRRRSGSGTTHPISSSSSCPCPCLQLEFRLAYLSQGAHRDLSNRKAGRTTSGREGRKRGGVGGESELLRATLCLGATGSAWPCLAEARTTVGPVTGSHRGQEAKAVGEDPGIGSGRLRSTCGHLSRVFDTVVELPSPDNLKCRRLINNLQRPS